MSEIPEDIVKSAELAWQPTSLECKQAIARAVLAERKRCADIAKSMAANSHATSKNGERYNKFERRDFDSMSIAYSLAASVIESGEQP